MSGRLQRSADGTLIQLVPESQFARDVCQYLEAKSGSLGILPGECKETAEGIEIHYNVLSLIPADALLQSADDAGFEAFVRNLAHSIFLISLDKQLRLGALACEFHQIYCDPMHYRPYLICLLDERATALSDTAAFDKRLMEQLRHASREALHTAKTEALWVVINDPFANIYSINTYFSNQSHSSFGAMQGGGAAPAIRMTEFPAFPQPSERRQDANRQEPVIRAVQYSMPVIPRRADETAEYSRAMGGASPGSFFREMDEETVGSLTVPVLHGAGTTGGNPPGAFSRMDQRFAMGMDESTIGTPPSEAFVSRPPETDRAAPARQGGFAMGMDQETVPCGSVRSAKAAPAEIHPVMERTPGERKEAVPAAPPPSARQAAEDKGWSDGGAGISPEQWQRYRREMREFWRKASLAAVCLFLALMAGIVVAAFLGSIGLIFYVLLASLLGALLVNRGGFTFKKPRKPAPAKPEPKAPAIEAVFSVRIKLRSVNLTSQVEIIIRENKQVIGSDAQACATPLKFRGISGKHCCISCHKSAGHTEYYVRDLKSKNGTRVNNERLKQGVDYPLHIGDQIVLANQYVFTVCSDAY